MVLGLRGEHVIGCPWVRGLGAYGLRDYGLVAKGLRVKNSWDRVLIRS
jgi:hypothetical protein